MKSSLVTFNHEFIVETVDSPVLFCPCTAPVVGFLLDMAKIYSGGLPHWDASDTTVRRDFAYANLTNLSS